MKTFKPIVPVLLLLLAACQRQEVPEAPVLVEHMLHASMPGEEMPAARTTLDANNDKKILWTAREKISIFSGGDNYLFQGQNETTVAAADFTGQGPADLGDYIALYPYNSLATYDGTYVSTSLSSRQSARSGTFENGRLITADDASGDVISFNHVCSGLRFMVNRPDITAVCIRGNNGEKIAGNFRFRFTGPDTPVAEEGTDECVVLSATGGQGFVVGKYYYIVILPTVFRNGFTITAAADGQIGELRLDSSVTFSRGAFKNITGNLDERMSWGTDPGQTYYGPENTFCIRKGGRISFDVSPRKIYGNWLRSGLPSTADENAGGELLWGGESISSYSLNRYTLNITASNVPGKALIGIKNADGNILWSFLVWVTAEEPAEYTLPGGGKILPALGDNLYFQWGRKDPLRSDATRVPNKGTDGLSYATTHPCDYIRGTTTGFDWFSGNISSQDGTLWGDGGSKTVWDPCPEGYRVPSEADFSGVTFDILNGSFPELGYIADDNYYSQARTFWTRTPTPSGSMSTALDNDDFTHDDPIYGQPRSIAAPVRCIKE